MGSDDGRRDERPAHEICFEQAFWIDRHEVTNAQYGSDGPFEGADIPRGNLNWYEARDYCQQRGGRLPTEAEWEYAARGVDGLLFPWGTEYDEAIIVIDGDAAANVENVGTYPVNASWVGAMDMIGNAFEWVSSVYAQYPYVGTDGREDMADTTSRRVYRGGRAAYQEWGVHSTTRFFLEPENRDWFIGLRCVQDT
jgi:iron(II)-dependent oxidoreductase